VRDLLKVYAPMSNLHVKYLLIGGGWASSSAAVAIREIDAEGTMLLVGQEVSRPYHRPELSKAYLRREQNRAELATLPVGWFAGHRIELRTGSRATHVDTARQSVALDSGQEVNYDRLLLATGATTMPLGVPGADLPNVFSLRTIEDADRLHHAIDQARREGRPHSTGRGRVAVIGAGLLGVEIAASLTSCGLVVDLISSIDPWNRFAGESVGRFATLFLEKHGVTVHSRSRAQRVEGDGRVQRIVLSDSAVLPCDFAVVAVGATPNKDLVRNTPIAAGRAILVDPHCRTNVKNVYAAGDCAAVFDPLFGKHRLLDHWDNAAVTGRLAGRNMAGMTEAYAETNRFTTKLFDLDVTVWGEPRLVDRRLLRGAPNVDSPAFAEVGVASDGRVVQVIAVGAIDEQTELRELVSRRLNIAGKEEQLKDSSVSLKSILGERTLFS
jgi:3-phenylpropionate/trans-cinnamate dioxygenase ferredoxin reductase subunit